MANPTNTTGLHVASVEVGSTANQTSDAFIKLASLTSAPSTTTGKLYNLNGVLYFESTSLEAGGGGSSGGFDSVYNNGENSITMDEGAITFTDATTGAANMLALVKSGAGSGNMLDVAVSAALTGNVIDIDMDSGIAAKAIYIDDGAGARTGADIQVKDDSTGAHSVIDIDSSGSGASVGLDWTDSYNGNDASYGIKLTLDANDGIDSTAMLITRGAGVRTVPAIDIDDGSTGSGDLIDVDLTGAFTGDVFDFASSAAATGNVFFVNLDNAVAMTALHVEGSGVRTQPMIELNTDATGSANVFSSVITGAISGNVMDFSIDTTVTGNVIDIDLNAGVAAKAIYIDGGAATRTAALVDMKHDGDGNIAALNIDVTNTGSGNVIELDVDSVLTGDVIDINFGTGAATGNAIDITTGTNLAGNALKVTTAGIRTAPVINIVGGGTDGGTDDHIIFITQSAVLDSNLIQLTYDTAASTGDALGITMGTNVSGSALVISGTGSRTDDLVKIDSDDTGSGLVFDVNITGARSGNILDIAFSAAAATCDAIAVSMGTAVAGSAIALTGTGSRTDDLIKIDDDSTGNSHIFDINMSGVYTGNVLDITFASAAATSDAISLAMGTDVAGRAIAVTSSATGTADEGSAFDVTHDGNLAAGADLVNITSTGSPSSTSNLLAIEQSSGAGSVGAYGLYISCQGTNVEAVKVDDGNVVFDENLTVGGTLGVTGATTMGTVLYKDLTETVAATNVIAATESGSVFFLNDTTEFVSTLPAPAAGLHFTFIVTGAPSGASYTVTTNSSANIIKGTVHSSTGGNADSETSGCDTVTFADGQAVAGDMAEFWCDGTNWFVKAFCDADAGITFDTAS